MESSTMDRKTQQMLQSMDVDPDTHRRREAESAPPSLAERARALVTRVTRNYVALSLAVGALTFVLLLVLHPPIVMKHKQHLLEKPSVSIVSLVGWSLLASTVMLAAPVVYRATNKKDAKS